VVAAAALTCAAGGACAQGQPFDCPMSPYDPGYVISLAKDRKAIELRKDDAPSESPPACVVALDCEAQDKPVHVAYDVRRKAWESKITMRNVRMVLFSYPHGRSQNCNAKAAYTPK
jgi:hypothetical protein